MAASGLHTLPDFRQATIRARRLNVSYNKLRILWMENIPVGLEELDARSNEIGSDGLVFDWPDTLRVLQLDDNPIYELEDADSLPRRLETLSLSRTMIRHLPAHILPPTLLHLDVSFTSLRSIPALPATLLTLRADWCRLNSLPRHLPSTLQTLSAAHNELTDARLPRAWPTSLLVLNLSRNRLRTMPRGLPTPFQSLCVAGNRISTWPCESEWGPAAALLTLTDNHFLEIPAWIFKRPGTRICIDDNCLTSHYDSPQLLSQVYQWTTQAHNEIAAAVQGAWRLARARRRLRAWRRMSLLRADLLAMSMHPDRAGRFEPISAEWTRALTAAPLNESSRTAQGCSGS